MNKIEANGETYVRVKANRRFCTGCEFKRENDCAVAEDDRFVCWDETGYYIFKKVERR